jgi:hypothetical protein
MLNNIVFNPINKGTLCPNTQPLRTKEDAFYPINLPDFGWEITLLEHVSADNLITLFIIYYTPEIMDIITEKINKYSRKP